MAVKKFVGNAPAIKQVNTWSGVDRGTGAVEWFISATGEDGSVSRVSYAQTTSIAPATSVILTNFTSNWNNERSEVVQRVTATHTSIALTLTAKTAGVPFRVAATTSSGAGSPDWGTSTATTSNSGPNVWHQAENWDDEAIAGDGDSVTVAAGAGSILYGLTSSGTGAAQTTGHTQLVVEDGYSGQIGGTDNAYFKIALATGKVFRFAGAGQAWIDIGSSNVDPEINRTFTPTTGQYGLSLKGTAVSDIYINKGNVGLGVEPGNSGTSRVDNININYLDNQASDADVTIGGDTVQTTTTLGPNVVQTGGYCTAHTDTHTVTVDAGVYTQKAGGITSSILLRGTGQLNTDSVASYASAGSATITMADEAVLDNSRTMGTKTIAKTITVKGPVTINDPNAKFTYSATPDIDLDQINMADVTLNLGRNITLVIAAS